MSLAACQQAFASAVADPCRPVPAGITCARGAADPARFAVYRNNVRVSLTKVLSRRFPVCERLVGTDFFTGMARLYTMGHLPASPVILGYGDDLPDFIETFGPARAIPYLDDVARIEAAWTRAYHAADTVPLDVAALATMPPAELIETILAIHPSATLVRAAHPAGSIWAAHQEPVVQPVAEWKAEAVLVVRPAFEVQVHVLPAGDADFAAMLFGGAVLRAAAERALGANPGFDFGAALVGLVSLGAFAPMSDPSGGQP